MHKSTGFLPNKWKIRIMRGFVQWGAGKIPTLAFLRKKHETWNSSRIPWSECYLLLRQPIRNQIHHGKRKLQHWGLLKLPSFLHRQTKNRGHCWSRGSLQSKIRQYVQTFYLMYCSRGSLKTGYSFSGCFFVGVWNGCGVLMLRQPEKHISAFQAAFCASAMLIVCTNANNRNHRASSSPPKLPNSTPTQKKLPHRPATL